MEAFVVAKPAAAAAKRKRAKAHPPERIKRAVTLARQVGAVAAVSTINKELTDEEKLTSDVVRQWLARWRKDGNFWENENIDKRGRPPALSNVSGGKAEWERQVDSLRAQGQSVTARVSSTLLRAVIEEKAPSLLDNHGGAVKCSLSASQRLLTAEGKTFRKRTSSRVLPPCSELADKRDAFYENIRTCFPGEVLDRELILNFDQTMQLYSPTRGYTWEKKGSDRVQLKENRDGFTLLPVVSTVSMVGAQLIFSGSSSVSLPNTAPGPLLRYAQTDSHWSTERTTIDLFNHIILPHIARRRVQLGNPLAPAIVFADAYAAHWTDAVQDLVKAQTNVAYLGIPDCLTHLFQPLDLGIIAAMKQSIMRRKDEFLEQEARTAIRENRGIVLSTSRPVLRDRIAMFIKEVVADPIICAEQCCRSVFARSGITNVLYGDNTVPNVDRLVPPCLCLECGELGFVRRVPPPCSCFADTDVPSLCDGCVLNHSTYCVER